MRSKAVVVLLFVAVLLSGAILFVVAQDPPPRLFTSKGSSEGMGIPVGGVKKLTDKEIREAVQRWWNDPSSPLKVRMVLTKKQAPASEWLWRSDDSDWLSVWQNSSPNERSRSAVGVPVTYRTGPIEKNLLFVIDKGSVVKFFPNYKHVGPKP